MGYSVNLDCPTCGPVEITYDPDTTIEIPPGEGVCPKCGEVLTWDRRMLYLGRFEPEGMKPGEFPTAEIKIIPNPLHPPEE